MKKIILLLAALLTAHITQAQWVPTNGPNHDCIKSLATNGSYIYAVTCSTPWLYVSPDNGATWHRSDYNDVTVVTSGANTFVGKEYSGVYLSVDSGKTWVAKNTGIENVRVDALLVDGSDVYAGTSGGCFISSDNGGHWTAINTGLNNLAIVLAFTKTSSGVFAGDGAAEVYITTNKGGQWTKRSTGLPANNYLWYNQLASTGTSLFLATAKGLYRSTNAGLQWTGLTNGLPANVKPASIAANGSSIFLGTDSGLYVSVNNGGLWTAKNNGISNLRIGSFAFTGSTVLAGSDGGIFKTSDNGNNWSITGIPDTKSVSFVSSGSTIITTDGYTVFSTSDKGNNWTVKGNADAQIYDMARNASYLFAAGWGGVYRSPDLGASWTNVTNNLTAYPDGHLALNGNKLFLGTYTGAFLSVNNGNSWSPANYGIDTLKVNCFGFRNDTIYAGTGYGLWISNNDGASWSKIDTSLLNNKSVTAIAMRGNTIALGTEQSGIYFSANGLNGWKPASTGLWNYNIFALQFVDTTLLAGTESGLFTSGNNGNLWAPTLTDNNAVYAFYNDGSDVFAGTDHAGVWKSSATAIAVHEINRGSTLLAYPNPVTSYAVISLDKHVTNADVILYDLTGKECMRTQMTGNEMILQKGSLLNGIYLLRITDKNEQWLQKIMMQ